MTQNSSMPFNHYDFMSRKGLNINYASYWTPLFNGSVFDENSYPNNRKNKAFEIRGVTIPNATITNEVGSFSIKNHTLAVFNSRGVLVEVIGGITEEEIKNLVAFTATWTPEAFAGYRLFWQTALGEVEDFSTISNEAYTFTVTSDNIAPADNGIYFSNIMTNPNVKFGLPFSISALGINSTLGVGMVKRTGAGSLAAILTDASVLFSSTGSNNVTINGIGNSRNDPTDFNSSLSISITTTVNTKFFIAIDETAGTYGTMYLYCSEAVPANSNDPNTPVAIYVFTAAVNLDQMDCFYSNSTVMSTDTTVVNIINNSDFVPTGVTNISGGIFDEDSWPINASGRAFTVTGLGLNNFVYIPNYGNAYDGDMIWFNAFGDIQGRPWGRDEIDKEVSINIGKHTSEHLLAIGSVSNTTPHPYEIINEDVYLNGRILNKSTNFPLDGDYRVTGSYFIELVTAIANPSGASLRISSFNY